MRNLLENAERHGGGEVEVEVTSAPPAIRVLDRGPGIPETEREKIFEAFYRPPGRRAEGEGGGVGLGLALVRDIAERHGAVVRCFPREGGGTLFEVSFGEVSFGETAGAA